MTAIHRLILVMLMALALGTTVVACGKKGDPTLPEGQSDNFPSKYPKR